MYVPREAQAEPEAQMRHGSSTCRRLPIAPACPSAPRTRPRNRSSTSRPMWRAPQLERSATRSTPRQRFATSWRADGRSGADEASTWMARAALDPGERRRHRHRPPFVIGSAGVFTMNTKRHPGGCFWHGAMSSSTGRLEPHAAAIATADSAGTTAPAATTPRGSGGDQIAVRRSGTTHLRGTRFAKT